MKKIIIFLIGILSLLTYYSCDDDNENIEVGVKSISVDSKYINLVKDSVKNLTVNILPKQASNKDIKWNSLSEDIVSVSESGEIKGLKLGTGLIVATHKALADTSVVYVIPEVVKPTSVVIEKENYEVEKGKSVMLSATVLPENTTDKTIVWLSADKDILEVNHKGELTGLAEGKAKIYVTTIDGSCIDSCYCTVTPEYIPVEGIKLDFEKGKLGIGEELNLTYKFIPENALIKDVKWTSANPEIATVDESGKITGVKEGITTITVTSVDNEKQDSYELTVIPETIKVTDINCVGEISLKKDETIIFSYTIIPENATNKDVIFEMNNTDIATVDEEGNITGIKEGKAVLTISTSDKSVSKEVAVTVTPPQQVETINLSLPKNELYIGDYVYVNKEVLPENAEDKTLTFTSSNEDVVTVSSYGRVQAEGAGTATITAESVNGVKGTIEITVLPDPYTRVSGFRISPHKTLSRHEDNNGRIDIDYFTNDDKYKNATWTISDDSHVDFVKNSDGEIELDYNDRPTLILKEGATDGETVTVTATREDGKTSECVVTVNLSQDYIPVDFINAGVSEGAVDINLADGEYDLLLSTFPSDATNQEFEMFFSDEGIISVSQEGIITPIKQGGTKLTIYSKDNGEYKEYVVTVK